MAADLDEARVSAVAEEIGAVAIRADVSREADIVALIAAAQERPRADRPVLLQRRRGRARAAAPRRPTTSSRRPGRSTSWPTCGRPARSCPAWLERGEGYLLSTASAAGLLTQVSALAYSITKHAAVALAEWMSITYGDAGIKVSCLCPQGVRTPMLDIALEDPVGAAPLLAGGLMEPEDVAAVVVEGLRDERFLILPHAVVADHMALKGAQPERWLNGMRRLVRQAREGEGS